MDKFDSKRIAKIQDTKSHSGNVESFCEFKVKRSISLLYIHRPHDFGIELGQRDNEKELEKLLI